MTIIFGQQICSLGAAALCRLAAARPADAVHCLAPLMLAMAASPDSFAHAPKLVLTEKVNLMRRLGNS